MFLHRATLGGGARHFRVVQESVFDLFSHLATVSSLISNADSESIVRFEIGAQEVPKKAIFVNRKYRLTPFRAFEKNLVFFPKKYSKN